MRRIPLGSCGPCRELLRSRRAVLFQGLQQDLAHLLGGYICGCGGHRRDVVAGLRILGGVLLLLSPPGLLRRALPPNNAAIVIQGHHILPRLFHPLLPRAMLFQFRLASSFGPQCRLAAVQSELLLGGGELEHGGIERRFVQCGVVVIAGAARSAAAAAAAAAAAGLGELVQLAHAPRERVTSLLLLLRHLLGGGAAGRAGRAPSSALLQYLPVRRRREHRRHRGLRMRRVVLR
mmetsp:Transcript_30489/g.73579  ORF Transcript_30489/g.73579 Transcript_30489/m.73579 type:complete len:234 (-) Transcript_30489:454-1155(-)